MTESLAENKAVVTLKDLVFTWDKGQAPLLHIPHWEISKTEKVFLYGASGSGKSTLLNLLSGTLTPKSGEIQLLGQAFSSLSSRQRDKFRARHIGVVFQQFNLIPYLSVRRNIELAAYFAGKSENASTQHIFQLFDSLHLPGDLLDKPVSELSVGQQQRVAIVRALINHPELLIVDEPTSALDSDARDGFMELLMTCCDTNDSTLLFVSHDRSLASYFSKAQSIDDLQMSQEAG